MELADRQRRYNELRKEAPSTVQRLDLGMLAAVIFAQTLDRTMWARDPLGDWPDPNDYDDARPDR